MLFANLMCLWVTQITVLQFLYLSNGVVLIVIMVVTGKVP